jgi:tRNA threonylcarbamoyladenosine biosynthesis protein TsaE
MDTFISKAPEDTIALGERWAHDVSAGWIIALHGDLGSGKTQLVKGLARGLRSPTVARSPTFALLNEYRGGRLPLYHLDLYRLDSPEAVHRAGLEEYLPSQDGVTAVEWAERWDPYQSVPTPMRLRRVWIEVTGEYARQIRHEDSGL